MGLKNTDFFESKSYEGDTHIIVCNECLTHLCLSSLVLLDKFCSQLGDAYLVDRLINVTPDGEDRKTPMRTGVYLINKIRCVQCASTLGWVYKKLFSYSELYKEGKYVIERAYIHEIPNVSTEALVLQARHLLRRRLSVMSSVSASSDEYSMKGNAQHMRMARVPLDPVLRLAMVGMMDNHDDVFVDT